MACASATSNTALLDVAKTAQVKGAVSKAAEALFFYDFDKGQLADGRGEAAGAGPEDDRDACGGDHAEG